MSSAGVMKSGGSSKAMDSKPDGNTLTFKWATGVLLVFMTGITLYYIQSNYAYNAKMLEKTESQQTRITTLETRMEYMTHALDDIKNKLDVLIQREK